MCCAHGDGEHYQHLMKEIEALRSAYQALKATIEAQSSEIRRLTCSVRTLEVRYLKQRLHVH